MNEIGVIAARILLLCEMKGVSSKDMLSELGIHANLINDMKKGRIPSITKFALIAKYFGVTLDSLVGQDHVGANGGGEQTHLTLGVEESLMGAEGLEPRKLIESVNSAIVASKKAPPEVLPGKPKKYSPEKIASIIEQLCKERNMSIRSMLMGAGVHERFVRGMKADGNDPQVINLAKVADYLNVSMDFIIGREMPQQNDPADMQIDAKPQSNLGD
jgi:transcriptional regulator with XRE-family HTH domain